MLSSLRQTFKGRASLRPFDEAVTFKANGLVLGIGTILVPFEDARVSLDADAAAHDRLVALLAVAGRGRLPAGCVRQVGKALDDWRRGDKALAAIRLAFARLPGVADWDEAYALFLAETLLDEGLPPRDLLAGLGTLAAVAPLLKGRPDQPRVPAGNGRASGEYGSTGGTAATAPSGRPGQAATPAVPAASQSSEASVIPVFLDTPHQHETKPPPLFAPESPSEAIQEGRPFDGFLPLGGPPVPMPAPDSGTSADQDKDGPACPAQRPARPNGQNAVADQREFDIAQIINPGDPTPKQAPSDPSAQSMAYYLPLPGRPSGEVEYDDCKRTSAPNAILGMRKGDMAEIKSGEATFLYDVPNSSGYLSFKNQIKAQNDTLRLEGKGRSVFYCMDNARVAALAAREFGMKNSASHFVVCH